MKQIYNLKTSFSLRRRNTLTQNFHSTLREKRIMYTLIYVRKFNAKVKFITQYAENILLMKTDNTLKQQNCH